MDINWSTFVLEIINFLILIWILKRFLYKPVLGMIARRQADIEKTLADAKAVSNDAQQLKEKYQNRLHEWETQKQLARDSLSKEIEDERTRLRQALTESLDQERRKQKVLDERSRAEARHQDELEALTLAGRFASKLLQRLGDTALEAKLIELTIDDLPDLPTAQVEALRDAHSEAHGPLLVSTAYPAKPQQREAFQQLLGELLNDADAKCVFTEEPALIAGVRISIGPWTVGANLRDELQFFTRKFHVPD